MAERINKIIYICYIPLTIKFEDDLYIKGLVDSGISVEYWDISGVYGCEMSLRNSVKRPYIKYISSYKELERSIRGENLDDTAFIPQIYYDLKVYPVYRMLSRHKCKMHYFARGYMPWASMIKKASKNIIEYFDIFKIANMIARYYVMIMRRCGVVRPYDLVFAAGNIARDSFKARSPVININHHDYDEYLKMRGAGRGAAPAKYCVFIDDGFPDHPDFKLLRKKTIGKEVYYSKLKAYFKRIEDRYRTEVIIAAHPKSEHLREYFPKSKIFHDQTAELVKNSEFALAHMSTAISYAVLFEKPLLFIYIEEFKRPEYGNIYENIKSIAGYLGASLVNLDGPGANDLKEVNIALYDKYKYDYLTSKESENSLSGDIFVGYYKKHNEGSKGESYAKNT